MFTPCFTSKLLNCIPVLSKSKFKLTLIFGEQARNFDGIKAASCGGSRNSAIENRTYNNSNCRVRRGAHCPDVLRVAGCAVPVPKKILLKVEVIMIYM